MKVLLALVALSSSLFAPGATATEVVLSAPDATVSEVNGKCTGKSGAPGVCIATAKCTSAGGEYISNACPGTPADIKCCTKTSCGGGAGNCRWTSQCQSGLTIGHMCPGPSDFMCCLPVGDDTPNYPPPGFPAVNPCKQRSVDGARAIVGANPGKVREVQCIRDGCTCPGPSDHCCGFAVDLMCSRAGGVATTAGRSVAEWVMNHSNELNLKYVIWGQKIWTPSRDAVSPWSQWRDMEDRGSITANHWDHVHVSFEE